MWCAGSEALAKLSEKSREPKATGSDTQRARRRNLHTTLSCIPTRPPDAVQCQWLVYISYSKRSLCLLLISAIISRGSFSWHGGQCFRPRKLPAIRHDLLRNLNGQALDGTPPFSDSSNQLNYLTFFDKIGGAADIRPVSDIWTLSARSRAWSA